MEPENFTEKMKSYDIYSSNYVSLIKINGKPILPPVMTLQKQKEMQMYRLQAVELESKLMMRQKCLKPFEGGTDSLQAPLNKNIEIEINVTNEDKCTCDNAVSCKESRNHCDCLCDGKPESGTSVPSENEGAREMCDLCRDSETLPHAEHLDCIVPSGSVPKVPREVETCAGMISESTQDGSENYCSENNHEVLGSNVGRNESVTLCVNREEKDSVVSNLLDAPSIKDTSVPDENHSYPDNNSAVSCDKLSDEAQNLEIGTEVFIQKISPSGAAETSVRLHSFEIECSMDIKLKDNECAGTKVTENAKETWYKQLPLENTGTLPGEAMIESAVSTRLSLATEISSLAPSSSTDINQYLNTTLETSSPSSTSSSTLTRRKSDCNYTPAAKNFMSTKSQATSNPDLVLRDTERGKDDVHEPAPKLVRQLSYTLEAPSPILLAHMEKCGRETSQDSDCVKSHSKDMTFKKPGIPSKSVAPNPVKSTRQNLSLSVVRTPKAKRGILSGLIRAKSNSEHNIYRTPKSGASTRCSSNSSVVSNSAKSDHSKTPRSRNVLSFTKSSVNPKLNQEKQKHIARYLKDVNSLPGSMRGSPTREDGSSNLLPKDDVLRTCSSQPLLNKETVAQEPVVVENKYFKELLQKMQEEHKTQMFKLLEEQRKQQEAMQKEFVKQQKKLLDEIKREYPDVMNTPESRKLVKVIESFTADSDTAPECNENSQRRNDSRQLVPNEKVGCGKKLFEELKHPLELTKEQKNFSNSLVPSLHETYSSGILIVPPRAEISAYQEFIPQSITQKALTLDMKAKFFKLPALVKGYLTRRLLQTDRVQGIIKTIRDTLSFVIQLNRERPANLVEVKESDVELNRRLLHQLNAACYDLHDVFFSLTTKERMAIIAADRELLQKRQHKPQGKGFLSAATRKSIERKRSQQGQPYLINGNVPSHPPAEYHLRRRRTWGAADYKISAVCSLATDRSKRSFSRSDSRSSVQTSFQNSSQVQGGIRNVSAKQGTNARNQRPWR